MSVNKGKYKTEILTEYLSWFLQLNTFHLCAHSNRLCVWKSGLY